MAWRRDGSPATLPSRATDRMSGIQPTRDDWLRHFAPSLYFHHTCVQGWQMDVAGKVADVYVWAILLGQYPKPRGCESAPPPARLIRRVIPSCIDHGACAHSRHPMAMMCHAAIWLRHRRMAAPARQLPCSGRSRQRCRPIPSADSCHRWARSTPRPALGDLVFLADGGFILKPDLNGRTLRERVFTFASSAAKPLRRPPWPERSAQDGGAAP